MIPPPNPGTRDDADIHGFGGHLFWRNPDVALVGVTASYAKTGVIDIQRYGVEGELYLGPITLGANAGWQRGDLRETIFGGVDARWYITDNLVLEAGG